MKLSILIPVYNERYLVGELVRRVLAAPLPPELTRELVIVDDGSTDGTRNILSAIAQANPDTVRYLEQPRNMGKGAAIRAAIAAATGEFCIFQDADLEYDPNDYGKVLAPLLSGQADVVYGSRFLIAERRRVLYFRHAIGNRLLTTLSNLLTDLYLTDMETCFKAFRTKVLKSIPIRSRGFGLEPEITAKVAKRGLRVYEVPVNYDGRTYQEGKKITWKDGVRALGVMLKYWIIDDLYDEKTGHAILSSISTAHRFNQWMADVAVRPYLGDRVLEIGAGLGNMSLKLMPRERYVATDCDELHLDVLRALALRRANMEAARLDAQQAADFAPYRNAMDTVVCLNVLEHIPKADEALRNMYEVLRPGARLILLVPNGRWLYSSLDRAVGHVQRYSRAEAAERLRAAGFEVEQTFTFNRVGVLGWFLNGTLLRRKKMAKFQLKAFDSLIWLWRRTDWLLPWPGLSLVAVARRPAISAVPQPAAEPPATQDAPPEAARAASK